MLKRYIIANSAMTTHYNSPVFAKRDKIFMEPYKYSATNSDLELNTLNLVYDQKCAMYT